MGKSGTLAAALLTLSLACVGDDNARIPGNGWTVPPLPLDTFSRVDTLTLPNRTIQAPFLSTSKDSMTATTLRSRLVLITGGTSGGTALSEAEVYDQRTAEFTLTGSMGQARRHHTATLSSTGHVIVIGGVSQSGTPLVSAETYDPATGTFQAVQQMLVPRVWHTATALPSGEILVLGGFTDANGREVTPEAQALDPAARIWRELTPMQATSSQEGTPRALHTATLTSTGQVIVIGGVVGDRITMEITHITNSVTLFDPAGMTIPPARPQMPGAWHNVVVTGSNMEPARMGAHAYRVSTSAGHPVTSEATTQIVVLGGYQGAIGASLGAHTATAVGLSAIEDSPFPALSYYVLDIEEDTLAGAHPRRGGTSTRSVVSATRRTAPPSWAG